MGLCSDWNRLYEFGEVPMGTSPKTMGSKSLKGKPRILVFNRFAIRTEYAESTLLPEPHQTGAIPVCHS